MFLYPKEFFFDFLGLLFFLISSIILCSIMFFFGKFLGEKKINSTTDIPFESGIDSTNNFKVFFSVRFYLLSVFFVIFDAESPYIYIWSVSLREVGWIGFFEMFFFILVLLVSLFYLLKKGIIKTK